MNSGVTLSRSGRARARSLRRSGGLHLVVLDVDGVLTDGGLHVTPDGSKLFKSFGPDDHDAIKFWRGVHSMAIVMVTSDPSAVTFARAKHMDTRLFIAPANALGRIQTIGSIAEDFRAKLTNVVYMGDGYHDADTMEMVGFGIAPANAWDRTLRKADARTSRRGGDRAVAQALDFVGKELL